MGTRSRRVSGGFGGGDPAERTPSRPILEPPSGGPVAASPKSNCLSMGLENRGIEPDFGSAEEGEVNCRERLGGLLRYYYRDAA